MVEGLKRGQYYGVGTFISLYERLVDFYTGQLEREADSLALAT